MFQDRYGFGYWYVDLSPLTIPVLFIDNLPGVVAIDTIPQGRAHESISWKNTKDCMGFVFYANEHSVGAGIVVEGNIVTIARLSISEFFDIPFEDDSQECSLVCAIQIDYDRIYVGGIVVYNDKVAYAGSIVSAMGLAVSASTKINSVVRNSSDISDHSDKFNDRGESIEETSTPSSGDATVTYETYSGAHGFSFVSSTRNEVSTEGEVMISVMDLVQDDLVGLIPGFSRAADVFSMASAPHKEYVYIFMLSSGAITVNTYDGETTISTVKNINSKACDTSIRNVYQGYIIVKPSSKWNTSRELSRIFAPQGIFFRNNTFGRIVLYVPAENNSVDSYAILPPVEKNNPDLDWSLCEEEGEGIDPTEKKDIGISCSSSQYSLFGSDIILNPIDSDEILAVWDGTIAYREYFTESSLGIRSMSAYIPYTR